MLSAVRREPRLKGTDVERATMNSGATSFENVRLCFACGLLNFICGLFTEGRTGGRPATRAKWGFLERDRRYSHRGRAAVYEGESWSPLQRVMVTPDVTVNIAGVREG